MRKQIMKLSKIGFLVLSVLLVLSSCTKEEEYYYSDTDIYTEDFTVVGGDWAWDSSDYSFYYSFDYSEISSNVVNNGTVQVTALIGGSYRALPYTRYFIENGKEYAETINFEYNTGYIRFNVVALDAFETALQNYKPETFKFRVTIISYL